jgi:hypothetical protein
MADIENVPAAPAEEPTELPLADVDDVAGGTGGDTERPIYFGN